MFGKWFFIVICFCVYAQILNGLGYWIWGEQEEGLGFSTIGYKMASFELPFLFTPAKYMYEYIVLKFWKFKNFVKNFVLKIFESKIC